MSTKHKIFVTLAIIVSAFYLLEITLTILDKGIVTPVFIKGIIVVVLLTYVIIQFRKKSGDSKKTDEDKTVRID